MELINFPKNLENLLLRYIKTSFYQGTKRETFIERPFGEEDLRFFAKGAKKLSDLFTSERESIDARYFDSPELQAGYLLYFLPINFGKSSYVLRQIPDEFWSRPRVRILDLGAGPASTSLACLDLLKSLKYKGEIDITLVDQNKNILLHGKELITHWNQQSAVSYDAALRVNLQLIRSDLKYFRGVGNFDLVLLSHSLNEWRQFGALEKSEWFQEKILPHLTPTGILAILEPALKRPTRELMTLRDHLIQSGEFQVLAPCLHQEICPMLKGTRHDWCHFYVEWQEPKFLQRLDQLLENENRFLKVAYLLLSNSPQKDQRTSLLTRYRVVSNRMVTRGKTEIVLCGKAGRIHLTRLDRDRSSENAAFDQVKRGSLIEWNGAPNEGFSIDQHCRIKKKDSFKII